MWWGKFRQFTTMLIYMFCSLLSPGCRGGGGTSVGLTSQWRGIASQRARLTLVLAWFMFGGNGICGGGGELLSETGVYAEQRSIAVHLHH